MEEHLTMTKNELITTKAQLQDTTAQLDIAVNQITSLALLVNVQLTQHYSFQLVSMATLFKSTCPVTIMMTEYKDKKDNTIEWFSDPFYTHSKGYKIYHSRDSLVTVIFYSATVSLQLLGVSTVVPWFL